MATLDTHAIVKELIASGTPEKQAEAFVARFVSKDELISVEKELQNIVTKTDLRMALAELKNDILRWMIPFFLATVGLIITSFFS